MRLVRRNKVIAVTCSHNPTLQSAFRFISRYRNNFLFIFRLRSDRKGKIKEKYSNEKPRKNDWGIFGAISFGVTSTCVMRSRCFDIWIVSDLWCGLMDNNRSGKGIHGFGERLKVMDNISQLVNQACGCLSILDIIFLLLRSYFN